MPELNSIVEKSIKTHAGIIEKELNESIIFGLENRLLSSVYILTKYKDAKKSFRKTYFLELLTLHHGNIKRASMIAGIDRRQIHRICQALKIDTEDIRQKLIKPHNYLKQNIQEIVEQKVSLYKNSNALSDEKLEKLYKKIPLISEMITTDIDKNIKTYDDAFSEFEENYFKELLNRTNNDLNIAKELSGLSMKTISRKIKR